MVNLKTPQDIKKMQAGGHILAKVLMETVGAIKPGVSEKEIDALAERLIKSYGAKPGFKMVQGYKNAICISTNNSVVHGIPTNYKLNDGDIVGVDCGVYYEGFHTDMSETVKVQKSGKNIKDEKDIFLEIGKRALDEAIKTAIAGNRVGNISETIQDIVEGSGYSVVRTLIGHGVGRALHEDPEIPGFLDKDIKKTPVLKKGMTIAIEVIYNMGAPDVIYSNDDGWTITTRDGSLSGLFERTVAIVDSGPLILTQ
jgi:methionyl aminopeptidase